MRWTFANEFDLIFVVNNLTHSLSLHESIGGLSEDNSAVISRWIAAVSQRQVLWIVWRPITSTQKRVTFFIQTRTNPQFVSSKIKFEFTDVFTSILEKLETQARDNKSKDRAPRTFAETAKGQQVTQKGNGCTNSVLLSLQSAKKKKEKKKKEQSDDETDQTETPSEDAQQTSKKWDVLLSLLDVGTEQPEQQTTSTTDKIQENIEKMKQRYDSNWIMRI